MLLAPFRMINGVSLVPRAQNPAKLIARTLTLVRRLPMEDDVKHRRHLWFPRSHSRSLRSPRCAFVVRRRPTISRLWSSANPCLKEKAAIWAIERPQDRSEAVVALRTKARSYKHQCLLWALVFLPIAYTNSLFDYIDLTSLLLLSPWILLMSHFSLTCLTGLSESASLQKSFLSTKGTI